jgi:hypothetical protein
MQNVFADLRNAYGRIDGVVHAAGVPGGGAIARRTDQEMESVLRPKTTGTKVLSGLLAGSDLDFLVFCSSMNSFVPIPGQADYAAANAFLDTQAALLRRQGVPALAINWDAWRDVGMAVSVDLPEPLRSRREEELAKFGLDPRVASDAFLRLIGTGFSQVAVSTTKRFFPGGKDSVEEPAISVRDDDASEDAVPGNVSEGLARVWKKLLGVSEIAPGDDFFRLGGHSLLATSVTFRIRQLWGCKVTIDELFTHATLESLAQLIEGRMAISGEREVVLL